jgi:hypothetical protein
LSEDLKHAIVGVVRPKATGVFPVVIGNVSYLSGQPSQEELRSTANSMVGDPGAMALAARQFSEGLKANGRPHKNIETAFGLEMEDLLAAGAGVLTRAPWPRASGEPVILEAHGKDISGWWMVAAHRVMLHMRFAGHDAGLSASELACALAGKPDPNYRLTEWIGTLESDVEGIRCVPEWVNPFVHPSFTTGSRCFTIRLEQSFREKADFFWHEEPEYLAKRTPF